MPCELTILHLSDLQFGANNLFPDAESAFEKIEHDLNQKWAEPYVGKIDLVVVTGDLAEWGMKNEFDQAFKFLGLLGERLKLPPRRLPIIPGNHDLNRKACQAFILQEESEGREAKEPYWGKYKQFLDGLAEFYKDDLAFLPTKDRPWSIFAYDDLNVVVAGLNSTYFEKHVAPFEGRCGDNQYHWFANNLRSYNEKEWLRIGLVHHNFYRRATLNDDNLVDVDPLRSILLPSLDVVLHGHTHLAAEDWPHREKPVLATGSAFLKPKQRPDEVPNQYQLLHFGSRRFTRIARRYLVQDRVWGGDTSISTNKNDWKVEYSFVPPAIKACADREKKLKRAVDSHHAGLDLGLRASTDFHQLSRLTGIYAAAALRWPGTSLVPNDANQLYDYLRVQKGPNTLAVVATGTRAQLELFLAETAPSFQQPGTSMVFIIRGIVPEPLARDAARLGVSIQSLHEFQNVWDLSEYVAKHAARVAAGSRYLRSLYVPHHALLGPSRQPTGDLAETLLDRLTSDRPYFGLVLGKAGYGKSFLVREVARRIAERHPTLYPIVIDLGSLEKARTLRELLGQALSRENVAFDPDRLKFYLEEGKIVLLFDGFDELETRVTFDSACAHFDGVLEAVRHAKAKVILTSRPEHFETDDQAETYVRTRLMERSEQEPSTEVVRLQEFGNDQIHAFLRNYFGDEEKAQRRWDLLKAAPDLPALAKVPRMLAFIVEFIDEDELGKVECSGGEITRSDLYRRVLTKWIETEIEKKAPSGAEPGMRVQDHFDALRHIAVDMWTKGAKSIGIEELKALTEGTDAFLPPKGVNEDELAHNLLARSLFARNNADRFEFVHRSIMEWLVADQARVLLASNQSLDLLYGNVEMSQLHLEMTTELADRDRLASWIQTLRQNRNAPNAAHTNANALAQALGFDEQDQPEEGIDWSGVDHRGKVLRLNFARPILRDTKLSGVRIHDSTLIGADLTNADLQDAQISRSNLSGANFQETNLRRARLTDVDLTDVDLSTAQLARCGIALTKNAVIPPLDAKNTFGYASPDAGAHLQISALSFPESLAINPLDNDITVVGYDGGSVKIWDSQSGELIRVLEGHEETVTGVAFAPSGEMIASASDDGTVRLWDAQNGELIRTLEGHGQSVEGVTFDPLGERIATASRDGTVRLWNTQNGELIRILKGHAGPVIAVAFNPSGERIASASWDHTIRIWNANSGKLIRTLRGHERPVVSLAFDPLGEKIASSSWDWTVRVWNARSGKAIHTLKNHRDWVVSVAFDPSGNRIASASHDGTVSIWNTHSGEIIRTIQCHEKPVASLAFDSLGEKIASASWDQTVRVWNTQNGDLIRTLEGHGNPVQGVAFDPSGEGFASASHDGTVRLWSTRSGELIRTLVGHEETVTGVAFDPSGEKIASASHDGTIKIWNARSGEPIRTLEGNDKPVEDISFDPSGERIVSASDDGTVRLWDAQNGELIRSLEGHGQSVKGVTFDPLGERIASSSRDGTVRLWSTQNGELIRILEDHGSPVEGVAFDPSGERIASASHDGNIRIWNARSGELIRTLESHEEEVVIAVSFDPSGERIASASRDGTVTIWSARSGKLIRTLEGHEGAVAGVTFDPLGERVASVSRDGTIRIWNLQSGQFSISIANMAGWLTIHGNTWKGGGDFNRLGWYAIGLCRYRLDELPEGYPGTLRRIPVSGASDAP